MIQLLENVFAVEVPDDAKECAIKNGAYVKWLMVDGNPFVPINNPARFRTLFTTKDCTEEQAAGIVEKCARGWKDYFDDPYANIPFSTAEYSLKSLLRSKGLDTTKNYLLIKKV